MDPVFDALGAQVTNTTGTMASAATLIRGIADRVQAGIDAALANGATPEAVAQLVSLKDALDVSTQDLSAAVAANP